MGNVIGSIVVLTKDPDLDHAQVYSNKVSNSKFLGNYGVLQYSKPVIKKREKVVQITDTEYYLKNREDFQNFVKENRDIFIENALKTKQLFKSEFMEGELPKMIYLKKHSTRIARAEKAKYANHSEVSSEVFYDDIFFPETVSGNIAEIKYIEVNKYDVDILRENGGIEKVNEKLSSISYGQSIVVKCSPNIVISLSYEDYGSGSDATYERKFDRSYVDADFFLTPIRDHYPKLITDSQALVKMCEQRYEFTYVRAR